MVFPNLGVPSASSALGGGSNVVNVATQGVCLTNTADHLAIGTFDPVAYALAIDALTYAGPAKPTRIPRLSTCLKRFMPGVAPLRFAMDFATTTSVIVNTVANYPHIPAEPPLKCYVTAVAASLS